MARPHLAEVLQPRLGASPSPPTTASPAITVWVVLVLAHTRLVGLLEERLRRWHRCGQPAYTDTSVNGVQVL